MNKKPSGIINTLKASKGEEWLEARRREYAGYGYKDEQIDSEIAADFFGAAVTQKEFERQIKAAELNKSFTQKIIDKVKEVVAELKEIMQKLRGQRLIYDAALDTDAETLEFFVDNLERILNQAGTETKNTATEDGDIKYSVKHDKNGNAYWHIETEDDIFSGLQTIKDFEKAAVQYIMDAKNKKTVIHAVDGKQMTFIRLSAEEFTNSKESQMLKRTNSELFKQKMRMLPSLENILLNTSVNWQSPDHKNHKLFKERGFENYRGKVRIDNVLFNTVVRAGKTKFGDVFYDINLEVDQILPRGKTVSEIKKSTSVDTTVAQKSPSVNSILSDSGEKITKFQKKLPDVQEKIKKMSGSDDIDDVKRMAYGLADDFMKYAKAARLEMTETRGLMPQPTRVSEIVAKYNDYRKTGISNKQLESDITDIFTDYMNGVGSSGTLFNYITDTIMKRELNSYEVIGDETFKAVRAYTDGGKFKVSDATVGSLVDTFGSLGEINGILRENYGFTIAKETDARAENRAVWAPVGAQLAEESGYVFDGTDYSYTSKYTTENGYVTSRKVYQCESCEGCPYRNECHTSKYDRRIRISHKLTEQNQKATELITTDEGILLRMNRSIQVSCRR